MINKCKECGCVVRHGSYCSQKDGERVSDSSQVAGSVEIPKDLAEWLETIPILSKEELQELGGAVRQTMDELSQEEMKQNKRMSS